MGDLRGCKNGTALRCFDVTHTKLAIISPKNKTYGLAKRVCARHRTIAQPASALNETDGR